MSKTDAVEIDKLDPADFYAVMDEIIEWNNYEAEAFDEGLAMDEYERVSLGERMAMIVQDHDYGIVFVAKAADKVVASSLGLSMGSVGTYRTSG